MAKGRAVAIVLEAAEKRELTALTPSMARRRHWRNGRALFWRRLTASTTRKSPPRSLPPDVPPPGAAYLLAR